MVIGFKFGACVMKKYAALSIISTHMACGEDTLSANNSDAKYVIEENDQQEAEQDESEQQDGNSYESIVVEEGSCSQDLPSIVSDVCHINGYKEVTSFVPRSTHV